MRITIFPLSLTNDFEVFWDVDKNEFVVAVARMRLPAQERPFKAAKNETSKELSNYFNELQNGLKPIGGTRDGKTERFKDVNSLRKFIETSGIFYRTDISFEDLSKWHEEQKVRTLASWADRKKTKTDEKNAAKKKPLKNVVLKG